jgi:hypothetical protein
MASLFASTHEFAHAGEFASGNPEQSLIRANFVTAWPSFLVRRDLSCAFTGAGALLVVTVFWLIVMILASWPGTQSLVPQVHAPSFSHRLIHPIK